MGVPNIGCLKIKREGVEDEDTEPEHTDSDETDIISSFVEDEDEEPMHPVLAPHDDFRRRYMDRLARSRAQHGSVWGGTIWHRSHAAHAACTWPRPTYPGFTDFGRVRPKSAQLRPNVGRSCPNKAEFGPSSPTSAGARC